MNNPGDMYDADYFLRGKESGKSLYENYRWLPELTIPMAQAIANHCGMVNAARVLDFGCARGYLVRALRNVGLEAYGYDISEWALDNADSAAAPYLTFKKDLAFAKSMNRGYDWVIAKDVLEHVPWVWQTIDDLLRVARIGVFVVVPLSNFDGSGSHYVIEEYEKDITHTQRYTLGGWVNIFLRPGWSVEAAYRVKGVKDNYYKQGWERGNGFLTIRRIEDET